MLLDRAYGDDQDRISHCSVGELPPSLAQETNLVGRRVRYYHSILLVLSKNYGSLLMPELVVNERPGHAAHPDVPACIRTLTRQARLALKCDLLAHGIDLPDRIRQHFREQRWKLPLRTRSGASGGLDLLVDADLYINAPTNRPDGPRRARWSLLVDNGALHLVSTVARIPVTGIRRPAYYDSLLPDGTPVVKVGQQCSADRICIGLVRGCYFWKRERRCTFCSIGTNASREAAEKTPENVARAVERAHADLLQPARHVLLGGGTPNEPDYGAQRVATLCRAIKARCNVPVYAMLVPSKDPGDVRRLRDAGVDELGFNLEFFSERAAKTHMPGKHALVGRSGYVRALEEAVSVFGPIAARSLLVVGLEPFEETLLGVRLLCDLGVMPILSPFRALEGSDLARQSGWDAERFIDLYESGREIANAASLPLGPTCVPCQNNTLAVPEDRVQHLR